MNVTPASSATTTPANGAAVTSPVNSLSPDDFLTLLIAEMKNQDPTKPMDPAQMVSQLATVSQVSQSVKTNDTLSSLLTATSLSQAEQLIGKVVTSADGLMSGAVVSVNVTTLGEFANLANGQQVALGAGVTISAQ